MVQSTPKCYKVKRSYLATAPSAPIRRLLVLVSTVAALAHVGPVAAAEPAADPACAHATAGQPCDRFGRPGTCQPGECCHLDYAARVGDAPPPSVCTPCLTCTVAPPKLEPLVFPADVTPAAFAAMDATPTQPAEVTPVAVPSPSTATPAAGDGAPPPKPAAPAEPGHGPAWALLAGAVALVAALLIRRRGGRQP